MRPKVVPGSDIYYVLRQVPESKKMPYLLLHRLAEEFHTTSEAYREVTAAQQKLLWWTDEIKRTYQEQATHPLMQALRQYMKLYDLKEIEFLAMLEGAMLSSSTQIFNSEKELRQHYQHTGGILMQLKAKVLLDSPPIKLMHQLGIGVEILRHLIGFPLFLNRQHLYLSLDQFRQFSIDPQPVLQGKNLSSITPLLDHELKAAEQLIKEAEAALSIDERCALRPLFLEAGLKQKQLQKIAKKSWRIFDYHLELSPIVKFFFTEFS